MNETTDSNETGRDDPALVNELNEARETILTELDKVIVGQSEVIEQLLVALFAGGHCLLVGVPGLAKTLMIRTLSGTMNLDFNRIQFTPDLMPTDITGTEVIQEDRSTGMRDYRFLPGPIFANVILADEINRTPPKTQAALLEAMQEHQVTAGGNRHALPPPFFVLATQNPIEQEGTYPLPEAQLDRFMFQVNIDYPDEAEELEVVRRTTGDSFATPSACLSAEQILRYSRLVRCVPIAEHVALYAVRLARATRPDAADSPEFIKKNILWGAGPRAGQQMVLGAKARAVLHGRDHADVEDIRAMALPVMRHRIKTNFSADAEGITPDSLVSRLLDGAVAVEEKSGSYRSVSGLYKSSETGKS